MDGHWQVLANKGSLSVASSRFVCAEILSGLAHMHQRGVVYGDLKPENVLLDHKNHCKLSDFGSSRIIEEGEHFAQKLALQMEGPRMHIAATQARLPFCRHTEVTQTQLHRSCLVIADAKKSLVNCAHDLSCLCVCMCVCISQHNLQ